MRKKKLKRKWLFNNHGTKLRIKKHCGGFIFKEAHLCDWDNKVYKEYELAFKAMQRYSKKHYGEKAT